MRPLIARFAGLWLLLALLASPAARGAPLAVDARCTQESVASIVHASGWVRYLDGRVVLKEQRPVCWVRIDGAFDARRQLVFSGSWVDVILYDEQGRMLAQFQRGGGSINSIGSSEHIVMPVAPGSVARYARLSLVPGWGMPAGVVVETAELAELMARTGRIDNINLVVIAVLLTSALFLSIFALVLRFANYALLAAFLFLSACTRLLVNGQIFVLADNGPWVWPAWAAIWPLVNCVLALTCAAIGNFHKHSPRLNRAAIVVALLFLPLCLAWPGYSEQADQLNALLNVPMYVVLLAASAIGARRGDAACAMLLIGNILGAAVSLPGLVERLFGAQWKIDPASPLVSFLAVAADLAMALLMCVALARRQLELQRRAKVFEREAVALASHDGLTGLLNRDSIARHGDALSAAGMRYCVVVLNVDRFKPINEALGGVIADQLLQAVGARLQAIDGAVAARLHADQFCLIWPHAMGIDALRARVNADCARPVEVNGQMVDLPLSAGVADNPQPPLPMAQLLRNAELALDAARARQLPWMPYSAALERAARADLGLLSELDRAVGQGELRMFLQPKVRLADGAVPSAEALVRWQHGVRGMVAPSEFVPFAIKTGRIAALTDWMLEQAMALASSQRRAGTPLQISVNMSARDLARPGLAGQLAAMAQRHGALADDIRLEVTESEAMDDPSRALEAMRAICAAGFSMSIDDFGTGYSSLVYLQQMPVVELKIDRAFISHVAIDSAAAVLLRSTIELGLRLGLSVVAEGPETAAEWAMVTTLGCDFAQGWHAAAAMDVASFLAWRARHAPFVSPAPALAALAPAV